MKLDIFQKHQLRIAKDTLKMSDAGALVMGGMTKEDAKDIIRKFVSNTKAGHTIKRFYLGKC